MLTTSKWDLIITLEMFIAVVFDILFLISSLFTFIVCMSISLFCLLLFLLQCHEFIFMIFVLFS